MQGLSRRRRAAWLRSLRLCSVSRLPQIPGTAGLEEAEAEVKEIVKKKTAVKKEIVETKQEIVELEDKKENLTNNRINLYKTISN